MYTMEGLEAYYSEFMSNVWIDEGVWGQKSTAITLSAANYSQLPLKGRSGVPQWTIVAVFYTLWSAVKLSDKENDI